MCDSPHWPYPCDGPPPPRPCCRPSTRPGLPRGACSAPRCASRGRMRPGYSCSPIPIRSTYSGSWGGRSAVRAQLSAQRLGAALSPSEPEAGPRPGPERRDCPLTVRQPPRPRQLELWLATTRLPPHQSGRRRSLRVPPSRVLLRATQSALVPRKAGCWVTAHCPPFAPAVH